MTAPRPVERSGELVGRHAQCQRLDDLVAALGSGRGGAVVLSGESGVGKTVLLERLLTRADRLTVLVTRGLESEMSLSYAGLGDLVRPLLSSMDELPQPQSAALGAALALVSGWPEATEYAVCVATLTLLTNSAERRPVLVVVDDAHWLDAPSLSALLFAARRVAEDPVGVVFAVRDGSAADFDARGLEVMQIGGLDVPSTGRLIKMLRPSGVAAHVTEELWVATGGNPLAVTEVCNALNEDQLAGLQSLPNPLPVGAGVEAAFIARLRPLPATTRVALLIVALCASSEAEAILGALVAMGSDGAALDAAEQAGLIRYEDRRVTFTHPLMRSAVHRDAMSGARARAYEALAAATSGEAAVWYRAASIAGTDVAVSADLADVASRVRGHAGFIAAWQAMRRAAELTADPDLRARRFLAAARDASAAGRGQDAIQCLEHIGALTEDRLVLADAALVRGQLFSFRGTPAIGQEILIGAANAVQGLDRGRAAQLCSAAVQPALMDGRTRDAAGYARRAVALAREADDVEGQAEAKSGLVLSLIVSGDVDEARRILSDGHGNSLDAPHDGERVALLGLCRTWVEDYPRARDELDRLVDVSRQARALNVLSRALGYHCDLGRRTGDWVSAHASGEEAVRLSREIRHPATVGFALVILAQIDAAQGHPDRMIERLDEVGQMSGPLGIGSLQMFDGAAHGLLALAGGAHDEAITWLETVKAATVESGIVNPNIISWEADLVEAYWYAGRVEDAAAQLRELTNRAAATGLFAPQAGAARCAGLLARDTASAERHFRRAMSLHAKRPQPFEQARTALAFGGMLRRCGQRASARPLLLDALRTFRRLGADPFAERAAAELTAMGERQSRRADGVGVDRLTGQELQVALYVARGLSNPEVAAALFISRKTVEAHLSSTYRKMGIRTRTQLVAELAEAGVHSRVAAQTSGVGSGRPGAIIGSA